MSFTKIPILFQDLLMKKLLISSMLFVSLMSTINLTSLRLDNFIQLLDISSVIIGLELVFLNLCSIIRENLLFSESRRGFSLTFEIGDPNSSETSLPVLT